MVRKRLTTFVLSLVALGLLSYLVVFSVRVDEVAAHYRLGKVLRIIRPPLKVGGETLLARDVASSQGVPVVERAGWFLKLPWPFDNVRPVDQRVRYVDGPLTQLQLPDETHLIPRVYATWRVTDPVEFEQAFMGDWESAQERLKEVIGGRTPEVMGRYNLRDLVNTDPTQLKFDQIEHEIFQKVKNDVEKSEKGYGIEVCDLGITLIALPEDATAAVFSRMELERMTEAERLIEDGRAIKRTTVAAANEKRDITLAAAEGQARKIRAVGEAEAAKSYETFALDQDFAIFLRRLDAIRDIALNAAEQRRPITFVLSTRTEPFGILDSGPLGADGPTAGEPASPDAAPATAEAPTPVSGGGQ